MYFREMGAFEKEVSVIVIRSVSGETKVFPVAGKYSCK